MYRGSAAMRAAFHRERRRRIRIRSLKSRFRSRINFTLWTAEMKGKWNVVREAPSVPWQLPSLTSVLELIAEMDHCGCMKIHRIRADKSIVFNIDRIRRQR